MNFNIQHYYKRILIVDDEPFNLVALENIIKICGVVDVEERIEKSTNGQEAFEKVVEDVERNGGQFCSYDLILMDF